MKKFLIPCAFIITLFISSLLQARIVHVPADSSTIQAGIEGAVDGDTVLVVRGHYYERINFLGKAILVASDFILDNDTLTIDSTIIDGEDGGSVVTFSSNEDSNSIIRGFTITNGNASEGGGIYCESSSPTITNNTITLNSAGSGGGIGATGNRPTITNNNITSNTAYDGGGIYANWDFAVINNVISGNSCGDQGGGICYYKWYGSTSIIAGNAIIGNYAAWGGGIYCEVEMVPSLPTISNNTITSNFDTSFDIRAGAITINIWAPVSDSSTASRNSLTNEGGARRCQAYLLHAIYNNIINGNSGHGICSWDSRDGSLVIINNIISNNLGYTG
jgi:hypothetical protein